MVRTQVYLTETERSELAALAKATGKKQSELIRDAVDSMIEQSITKRRQRALKNAAGMWKDREDLEGVAAAVRVLRKGRGHAL